MSFFGITQLGYQNKIREYIRNPIDHSQSYLPPIEGSKPKPQPSVLPVDQMSGYGPGPEGSYKELRRLEIKHIRCPSGKIIHFSCLLQSQYFLTYFDFFWLPKNFKRKGNSCCPSNGRSITCYWLLLEKYSHSYIQSINYYC